MRSVIVWVENIQFRYTSQLEFKTTFLSHDILQNVVHAPASFYIELSQFLVMDHEEILKNR
jgi:hypothetical protein